MTPSSKVVGDMALMMVSQGLTPRGRASIPTRTSLSRPRSSRCCAAIWASRPGGWPQALQAKVLKGDTPITVRPGSLLAAADLAARSAEARASRSAGRSRRPSSPPI